MRNVTDPSLKNVSMLKPSRQLTLFLVGLFGLMLFSLTTQFVMDLIARGIAPTDYDYETFISSTTASMIINGLSYLVLGVTFILLIKDDSNEILKSFKGYKPYVAAAIGFASIIMFNLFYNLILSLAGVTILDNANESSLNSIVTAFPMASLLFFAFIGPVCEELTYRVGLFSLTRRVNRILAYIVTIIVFTLIHFDFTSKTIVNELLNIPFYAFAAFVFTFLYEKFGLASSVSAHITNNLFSLLVSIFGIIR